MDESLEGKYTVSLIHQTLDTLFSILEKNSISAALIGGVSIDAWGVSRATQDIDVMVAGDQVDIPGMVDILSGEKFVVDGYWRKENQDETRRARMLYNDIQVDILIALDAVQKEALRSRVKRNCYDREYWVLRPEYIIILKMRLGRPRDIDDIISLLHFNRDMLDYELMNKYIRTLHLTKEWRFIHDRIK